MPLSERAQEAVSTPERLCASGQPLASPFSPAHCQPSPANTGRPALGGPPERAWLVSLARVAEHDLVPGRHRGPLAARRLPALARRLLTRGFSAAAQGSARREAPAAGCRWTPARAGGPGRPGSPGLAARAALAEPRVRAGRPRPTARPASPPSRPGRPPEPGWPGERSAPLERRQPGPLARAARARAGAAGLGLTRLGFPRLRFPGLYLPGLRFSAAALPWAAPRAAGEPPAR